MPIYEYQCSACGHTLDALQKISDAPLTDCPSCQKSTLQKQVSAASFQLKGTGWYATDFRNKPDSKKESSTKENTNVPPSSDSKSDATAPKDKTKTDPTGT